MERKALACKGYYLLRVVIKNVNRVIPLKGQIVEDQQEHLGRISKLKHISIILKHLNSTDGLCQ
jgi:hypothetical protein